MCPKMRSRPRSSCKLFLIDDMSSTFRTHAIVLGSREYREADRYYSALTAEHGLLELRARGSRKISSKLAAHLEPFALCDLMVVRGRGGDLVAGVERLELYPSIRTDITKALLALESFHLIETSMRPKQPDGQLFSFVRSWLQFLNQAPELTPSRERMLLSAFTTKLLGLTGYRPQLGRCMSCEEGIVPNGFRWHGLRGGVVCLSCATREPEQWFAAREMSMEALKLVRVSLEYPFASLLDLRLPGEALTEFHEAVDSLVIAHFPVIPLFTLNRAV